MKNTFGPFKAEFESNKLIIGTYCAGTLGYARITMYIREASH